MGGIGGSLWHGIKGFKNSPRVNYEIHKLNRYVNVNVNLNFIVFLG